MKTKNRRVSVVVARFVIITISMKRVLRTFGLIALTALLAGVGSELVRADEFSSPNYKINGVVGNSFGGGTTSAAYTLESSGGESIIGNGTGGSYLLGEGYVAQIERSIQLTLDLSAIDFGTIVPGTSTTRTNNVRILTDASDYNLMINSNQNLTSGANTIAASGIGTIAAPTTWTEGTTKGMGFSVASSTPTLPPLWSTGTKYAVIPTSATTFFNRTGVGGGVQDVYGLNFRLDATNTQVSGTYTNTLTFTGVTNP